MKEMCTLTVFEILLFKGRLVLWPVQRVSESRKVTFSVENQKNVQLLLELFEKWLCYKLSRFWIAFNFFVFVSPFSPRKIEKLVFWDSNNSPNLKHQQLENHKRKSVIIGYSLQHVFCEGNVYSHDFRDIAVRR